jgi:hypothetical protein
MSRQLGSLVLESLGDQAVSAIYGDRAIGFPRGGVEMQARES